MERTFKAPAMEYNNQLAFQRFKYAEEAAKRLTDDDRPWVMFRGDDRVEAEEYWIDGVLYQDRFTVPQFMVLWNE